MTHEARLRKIAHEMTNILCDRADNPTDYITILTGMLGIALAGLRQGYSDDEFEAGLDNAASAMRMVARDSRERLKGDEEPGEWVSVH